MRKIAVILFIAILSTVYANGADGGRIYSATRKADSVGVRLIAPENALLFLGAYDSYTHQMKDIISQETGVISNVRVITVKFDRAPASTEYVKAFLLDKETFAPICVAVLSDVVITSG